MTASARPFMRAKPAKRKDWFRIDNLYKDDAQSSDSKAVIYIYDEIGESWWGDSTSSSDFIRQVSGLSVNEIELHINSPGGDIFDGIAIYQALKAHPAEVTVYVDALAASAASFIAQAGDTVIMTQAATMMIHDGSAMAWGTAADMRSTADLLDKLSNTVAGIYQTRAGKTEKFWRDLMIQEVWYNAQEAVDAGLADEVGGQTEDADSKATNKWDLSIFNYAGRDAAPNPLEVRTRIANKFIEENAVTDTSGTEGAQTAGTGSPDTDPDAQSTGTGDTGSSATEGNEGTEPGGQADSNPDAEQGSSSDVPPTAAPAETGEAGGAAPAQPQNANALYTFQVGGQAVQMTLAQAAAQMDQLQTFQTESITSGKKAFVKALHDNKKITGPQVKATEDFAMSLTDEQYDSWKATWEGASAIPMLQTQVGGTSNHSGGDSPDGEADAAEIEKCLGVVKSFQRSNMPKDTIQETPSYKRLMQLKPDFQL